MKSYRFILILFLSIVLFSCNREDTYVVHGNLRCVRAKMAYMMEVNPKGEPVIIDSVPIRSGEFKFKGHVDYPTMRFIRIGTRSPFDVFVENEKINIKGSLLLPDEIKIEGSYSHDEFNALSKEYKQIINKQNTLLVHLSNARKRKDYNEIKRLYKVYNTYPDSVFWMAKRFVLNNPTSMGATYFICSVCQSFTTSQLEEIIKILDVSIQQSPYAEYLKQELAMQKKFVVGMTAPNFELPTFLGDTVRLSNYKGKYLYIDFGASWCSQTKSRFAKFKYIKDLYDGKNFDILSVSLDVDKKELKGYLSELGLIPWKIACDFQYWSSPITKYYKVQSIPYGVLISPEGKVALVDPPFGVLETYLRKNVK